MRRSELEHLIRAAGAMATTKAVVIIGSQAILAQFPDAPSPLTVSAAADIFPHLAPDKADLIDVNMGEGSSFHQTHGYYAQGVGEKTAILPKGWEKRLIPVCNSNTNGITGLCLEVHDLAISKHVAGRPKDLEFTRELASHSMTRSRVLLERLADTEVDPQRRKLITARILRDHQPSR
jgi:uncharacterized nucleotidyltransferase DUF6036